MDWNHQSQRLIFKIATPRCVGIVKGFLAWKSMADDKTCRPCALEKKKWSGWAKSFEHLKLHFEISTIALSTRNTRLAAHCASQMWEWNNLWLPEAMHQWNIAGCSDFKLQGSCDQVASAIVETHSWYKRDHQGVVSHGHTFHNTLQPGCKCHAGVPMRGPKH